MKQKSLLFIIFWGWLIPPIMHAQQSMEISDHKVCPNENISFEASPDGYTYEWNLGDGTSSTQQSLDHFYDEDGTYPVSLTFFSGEIIDTILYDTITIFTKPIQRAQIKCSPDTICPGESVGMQEIRTDDFIKNIWDFGDGNKANIQSYWAYTWNYYTTLGTYPVSATFINKCGYDTTVYDTVYVVDKLPEEPVSISIQEKVVCPGAIVNISGGGSYKKGLKYYWHLGDGNTSKMQKIRHIYDTTGTYQISLSVTNGYSYDTILYDTVLVTDTASIYSECNDLATKNIACPNTQINFYYAFDDYESYRWDFGNGYTTTQRNVQYAYSDTGKYVVSVTVTNICGNSKTFYDTIHIMDSLPVENGVLQVSEHYVCPTDSLFFLHNEEELMTQWNFGDGSTSNQRIAKHQYTSTGTYPVTLTLTNNCGNEKILYDTIHALNSVAFNAKLNISRKHLCPGDTITFSSNKPLLNHEWNFGDGHSYIQKQKISYSFNSNGSYPISLTLTNGCGQDTVLYDTVTVGGVYLYNNPRIYDHDSYICPNDSVLLRLRHGFPRSPYQYSVNYGDGTSSGFKYMNPSGTQITYFKHAYSDTGDYLITITRKNRCGVTITDSFPYFNKYKWVHVTHDAQITEEYININFAYPGKPTTTTTDSIRFSFAQGYNYSEWDFGDGTPVQSFTHNEQMPVHQYSNSGNYLVKGTFTTACGYSETIYRNISVDTGTTAMQKEITTQKPTLKLYPNPSNDGLFNLKINTPENNDEFSVEIMNISGKTIYIEPNKMVNVTHQLDLSHQPSGMYFVKVKGTQSTVVKKVIIR